MPVRSCQYASVKNNDYVKSYPQDDPAASIARIPTIPKSKTLTCLVSFVKNGEKSTRKPKCKHRSPELTIRSNMNNTLFLSSKAAIIQQILQLFGWFRELSKFSHPARHRGFIVLSWRDYRGSSMFYLFQLLSELVCVVARRCNGQLNPVFFLSHLQSRLPDLSFLYLREFLLNTVNEMTRFLWLNLR